MANGPMIHPKKQTTPPAKPAVTDLPPEANAHPPTKVQQDAEQVRSEFKQHIDDLKIDHNEYDALYGSIANKFADQLTGRADVKDPDGLTIRGLGWDLDVQLNEVDEQGKPIVDFESGEDRKNLEFLLGKMSNLPPSEDEARGYLTGNTLNNIVTSDLNAEVKFKDMTPEAQDLFGRLNMGDVPDDTRTTFVSIPDLNTYAAITDSRTGRFSSIDLLPYAGGEGNRALASAYLEGSGRWNRPMTPR